MPVEDILVYSADTDLTPFDVGAYASGTTYISGMAVKKAAEAGSLAARRARRRRPRGRPTPPRSCCSDRCARAPDGRSVTLAELALRSLHTEDRSR